jgi:hypothetical protein
MQKVLGGYDDGRDKTSVFYRLLSQIGSRHTGIFGGLPSQTHLSLNRLHPPVWKNVNFPVLNNSPITRLIVNDVGGHARAIELVADELDKYQNQLERITLN